jgi:hypothetical protein
MVGRRLKLPESRNLEGNFIEEESDIRVQHVVMCIGHALHYRYIYCTYTVVYPFTTDVVLEKTLERRKMDTKPTHTVQAKHHENQ